MKYKYTGPPSGVTLIKEKDEQITEEEVMLHYGNEYDLPEDHTYIKTLVALGLLIEVKQEEQPVEKTDKKKKEAEIAG